MADESVTAVRAVIDERSGTAHPRLVQARRHLHAHPELSNREVLTAGFVAERLRAAGLDEVRTRIAGHGVLGVLQGRLPGDRATRCDRSWSAITDIAPTQGARRMTESIRSRIGDYTRSRARETWPRPVSGRS